MFQFCKVVHLSCTIVAVTVTARLTCTTAGRWPLLLMFLCMIHKQNMVPGKHFGLMQCQMSVQVFSPVQYCRLVVHSFPMWPDILAICTCLAKSESEHAEGSSEQIQADSL